MLNAQSGALSNLNSFVVEQEVSKDESCMAVGSRGSELNIWDVRTQQQTFLAKSAKPNRIGLMDPPWCSAVAFLPGSDNSKVFSVQVPSITVEYALYK